MAAAQGTKIRWICRQNHAWLTEGDLEMMSIDFQMPVKACELDDCASCKEKWDKVLNEDGTK